MGEVAWGRRQEEEGDLLRSHFHRVARRRGQNKAVIAVAHSLLVVIYHVLRTGRPYAELGADYFDRLDATRVERHHVHRLEQLGYAVTLTPKDQAA